MEIVIGKTNLEQRRTLIMKKRVFISFDYDNDSDLKTLLVGQARNSDSPFEVIDMSINDSK